ncbi:MAG: sigma-70 family RNA polymerase sigma factor [Salinivirgaceae bacterium]|nr:sigma-70 family RNA polymerase sigma factor [Salinivirgaceae bacterium]
MSNIPGEKQIKEILNGNEKILKKVYKKVYTHIERYAFGTNISQNVAKEAVQDAFEIFYRQALEGNLSLSCTLETYIISIAKRVIHKEERDWYGRLKDGIDMDDEIDDVDEIVTKQIQEQKHRLFNHEFQKLDSECKTIISLTLEGYSSEEISKKMNFTSEEYTRNKRSKCKRYLIEQIKENPDYEKLRNANTENFELPVWENEQAGEY